jgi:drug/metabolite transporter (DMT)-like permease
MLYLLLSILGSTAIMIVFKLYDRFKINTAQAIVVNYFVAASLSFLFDDSGITFQEAPNQPWFLNAILMGVLFITLFNIIGLSAQKIGVSVTTVANKMSLIIPVLFSVFYLGESANWIKFTGIGLALVAVVFTSIQAERTDVDARFAFYPLIVFAGSGFIDAFFKYNQVYTLGDNGNKPFTGWIFLTSFILGIGFLAQQYLRHRRIMTLKDILGGIALGIPNYFSVFFLLKSLSQGMEGSVVIPVNNMAIVAASAVAGIGLFGEKVSKINILGIVLCVASIAMIAFSDSF